MALPGQAPLLTERLPDYYAMVESSSYMLHADTPWRAGTEVNNGNRPQAGYCT